MTVPPHQRTPPGVPHGDILKEKTDWETDKNQQNIVNIKSGKPAITINGLGWDSKNNKHGRGMGEKRVHGGCQKGFGPVGIVWASVVRDRVQGRY